MRKVVDKFNKAECPRDIGLYPQECKQRWNSTHPDEPRINLGFDGGSPLKSNFLVMADYLKYQYMLQGPNCGLQIGPNKDVTRVQAKVEENSPEDEDLLEKYPDRSNMERYVLDWLRGRVVFANPTALATFFWYLVYQVPGLEVVACKNKLQKRPDKDLSLDIHLNVRFSVQGDKHVGEVQLLFEHFLVARDLEHKYYEIRRATRLADVLAPVLEVPPDMVLVDNQDGRRDRATTKTQGRGKARASKKRPTSSSEKKKKRKSTHDSPIPTIIQQQIANTPPNNPGAAVETE
jgi:hypothetical protein